MNNNVYVCTAENQFVVIAVVMQLLYVFGSVVLIVIPMLL